MTSRRFPSGQHKVRRLKRACAPVLLMILAVSCNSPALVPMSDDQPPDLVDTRWKVTTLRGTTLDEGPDITMEIGADQLKGYGGCNWYGASYQVAGESFETGMIGATERACAEPRLNERERDFFRAMEEIATYELSENALAFRNDRAEAILELVPAPRFDMDPARLVGTTWKLQSMTGSPQPQEPTITMRLNESTFSGFSGCRDYTGTYVAESDEIAFTSLSMVQMDCGSQERLEREQQFTTELSESQQYRIRGDQLELFTDAGGVLVFDRGDR